MAKFEDTYVKCPFYKWEEGQKLRCEGVSHIVDNKAVRREVERIVCKGDWRVCPFAQALERLYFYGDRNET